MPVRGQSRRAASLGAADPRSRRAAQGALNEEIQYAAPVGLDGDGRVTLVQNGAMLGDAMRWNGRKWESHPIFKPTPLKTSAYSAKPGELVLCDPTSAGFTVTIPAASLSIGLPIVIKNYSTSANVITVAPTGQDTIEAATSYTLVAGYASVLLVPILGGWVVV